MKTTKTHAGSGRICGECVSGAWLTNFENLDINGQPFMKECAHADWCINHGHHYTLRNTPACANFKEIRK